jgi:hypothetical protein
MALAEITAALSALKASAEVGKAIASAGNAIEVAQLRLQLADMMGSLSEARSTLIDAQEAVTQLQEERRQLLDTLELKQKVVLVYSGYYATDEQGRPEGSAFCMRCWEVDHKLRHISYPDRTNLPAVCPACKAQYAFRQVRRQTPGENANAAVTTGDE